jgi:hypothetical protein
MLEAKRANASKAAAPVQHPIKISTGKGSNIAFIDVGKKFIGSKAKR